MMHIVGRVVGGHRVVKVPCGPVVCAVVVIGFGVIHGLDQVSNLAIGTADELVDDCTDFFIVDHSLESWRKDVIRCWKSHLYERV